MYSIANYPFGRLNLKTITLMPLLLLSMFATIPLANTSVVLNIGKISPTLWNEMANAGQSINVLIETFTNDYSNLVQQINDLGGKVGFLFKYVKGLSASLPPSSILELTQNNLIERIYFDDPVGLSGVPDDSLTEYDAAPTVFDEELETMAFTEDEIPSADLSNYWNTIGMGAQAIWPQTNMGSESLAVIIDTGIWTPHFMFAPKVALGEMVGGVDVSRDNFTVYQQYPPTWAYDPKWFGWNNTLNHFHGGHCAGILASRGSAVAAPGTRLFTYAQALENYGGFLLPPAPSPPYPAGSKIISLLGMAPAARLYIVKIFDHTGASIPRGIIITALEHVLDLKLVRGYDVDVVSMSFGGSSLFEGRTSYEELIDMLTASDITPVAAAGNNGPATMTVSTPGAANTAITAGMASNPVNTRAYWDYSYNVLGRGALLYTSSTPQIDTISSRGPTSDGRMKPTLSATGRHVLSANTPGGPTSMGWASGTSMATPAIAGATALLNSWSEMATVGASPEDYKQALTAGAVWLPGFDQYDQGAGYLNATAALEVLKADSSYGDVAPPLPEEASLVDINNTGIVTAGVYTTSITNLPPGHKKEYIFQATETANSIRLDITNVVRGNNPLGVNSFEVYIETAKRTSLNYYIWGANVIGNSWFYITDDATTWSVPAFPPEPSIAARAQVIEPGYIKIVVENDWTSFDSASADITITVTKAKKTPATIEYSGLIWPDQRIVMPSVNVPPGTTKAIVELWWVHGWNTYPATDLDLYIEWNNALDLRAATSNAPERVVLVGPVGTIDFEVVGYSIYTGREPFELRITFV